jgi:hypothetical protein
MSTVMERSMTLRNAFNKGTSVFSGAVDDPAVARIDVFLE